MHFEKIFSKQEISQGIVKIKSTVRLSSFLYLSLSAFRENQDKWNTMCISEPIQI